jgi:hypothetical protein
MKILKTLTNEDKSSIISISKEVLSCTFYENQKMVGEIEYPNNSFTYVEDAAENWTTGILTLQTIKQYGKT